MNRLFRIPRPDLPTDLAADLPADLPCGDPVNLSRRGFLLTSAGAAAGALVLGFGLDRKSVV